ncbi:Uncharacterised protein [Vibrio cholerae]|nr:Uncharacterised protein [Vibrio cholerae]
MQGCEIAQFLTCVQLTWTTDTVVRIAVHFIPVSNPTDSTRHRKDHREHRHRNTNGFENDA